MKTLIIYCHPQTAGHNPLVLSEVEAVLKSKSVEYAVLDLYAMTYDPVLSADGLAKRFLSEGDKAVQEMVAAAKNLVFIYPIWWGTMPALLKGFMDKVFSAGFAYKYVNSRPVGLLKGKTAVVFITSGAPQVYSKYILGNRYQRSMTDDILGFCGVKAKAFQVDKAIELNDRQKEKIKENVKKGLGWLLEE